MKKDILTTSKRRIPIGTPPFSRNLLKVKFRGSVTSNGEEYVF